MVDVVVVVVVVVVVEIPIETQVLLRDAHVTTRCFFAATTSIEGTAFVEKCQIRSWMS